MYSRRRRSKKQIEELNSIVKLRDKIRTAKLSISFYRLCLPNRISLISFLRHRGTGGTGGAIASPLFSKINNNVSKRSKELAND